MSHKLTESERKRASRAIQTIAECVGLVLLNPDDIFRGIPTINMSSPVILCLKVLQWKSL